eukprot:1159634-Pelagomonas_calceolata.AAC.1
MPAWHSNDQEFQHHKKNFVGRVTLPTSIKEKEAHWLIQSREHHKISSLFLTDCGGGDVRVQGPASVEQEICAACVRGGKACPKGDFADT